MLSLQHGQNSFYNLKITGRGLESFFVSFNLTTSTTIPEAMW